MCYVLIARANGIWLLWSFLHTRYDAWSSLRKSSRRNHHHHHRRRRHNIIVAIVFLSWDQVSSILYHPYILASSAPVFAFLLSLLYIFSRLISPVAVFRRLHSLMLSEERLSLCLSKHYIAKKDDLWGNPLSCLPFHDTVTYPTQGHVHCHPNIK